MPRFYFLLSCLLIYYGQTFGQENRARPSYKIGIEPVFVYKLINSNNNGYFGLRIGTERPFKKAGILSNNFTLAWSKKPIGAYAILINGQLIQVPSGALDIYYFKYMLNVYPFGKFFKSNPLQGLYFGAGPGFFYQTLDKQSYRNGLGLFVVSGVQFYPTNRFSLSLELELFSTVDFSSQEQPVNNIPEDNYLWYNLLTFKVGWIFNAKKKE